MREIATAGQHHLAMTAFLVKRLPELKRPLVIKFQRAEVKSLAHSFFAQRSFGNGGEVFPDH